MNNRDHDLVNGIQIQELQKRLADADKKIDALLRMQAAIQVVANESEGIVGWYTNGEIAKWNDLLPEIFDDYMAKSGEVAS